MTVTRRDAITRGGLAALGAVVPVSPLGASRDLATGVREVVEGLRNPPGETMYGTALAFQEVADRLERIIVATA